MFYIGKNNTLLERIGNNKTNLWRDGPLGQLGLLALDDRNVGLVGCVYEGFGMNTNASQMDIHLWYSSAANKIDELTFVYGSDQWVSGTAIFGYNGHAGISCYSWDGGSVTYLMLVNQKFQVEILWKELNTTLKSTTTHPVNQWTTGKFLFPSIYILPEAPGTDSIYSKGRNIPNRTRQHLPRLYRLVVYAKHRLQPLRLQHQLGSRKHHHLQQRC